MPSRSCTRVVHPQGPSAPVESAQRGFFDGIPITEAQVQYPNITGQKGRAPLIQGTAREQDDM